MKYKVTGRIGPHNINLIVEEVEEGFNLGELLAQEAKNKQGDGVF